ncbi:hypothetical protein N9971_00690, partial [bacterium]|nr:hypothetical protein [bacterium]
QANVPGATVTPERERFVVVELEADLRATATPRATHERASPPIASDNDSLHRCGDVPGAR